jgi:hypothetical protein
MHSANGLWRWVGVGVVVLLIGVGLYYVGTISITAGTPQLLTGKFMGLSIDGRAMAFQPSGSSTGTSYAWSGDTMWSNSAGVIHDGGNVACVQPTNRGHTITIGVVETKPVDNFPGTNIIAFVRC